MKALSIHPYYAIGILCGDKKIEVRTWKTDYRGDLLIVSTNKKIHGLIPGHALCVVTLADVVPFTKAMCRDAVMDQQDYKPGLFAWKLENPRLIKPIPLKGKLSLWEYDGEIEYVDLPDTDEEIIALQEKLWDGLIV